MNYLIFFILAFFNLTLFAAPIQRPCQTICTSINKTVTNGEQCVQLGGKQIYLQKAGEGKPTVIFSSGTGMPASAWFESNIANEIAKKSTVFVYDRTYTFNSCNNKNDFLPITANSIVSELHQLLTLLKLTPPYILVGHSMGGLYMLHYAKYYPQEVVGLVLLDASSDQGPTPLPKAAIPILKKLGNPQDPPPSSPLYNEIMGQSSSYIQAQQAPLLRRNIPVIVLSANRHCLPIAWTKKPMCMTTVQEKNHQRLQKQMANLSDQGKYELLQGDHNFFFTKAGHFFVINAINQLLENFKNPTKPAHIMD